MRRRSGMLFHSNVPTICGARWDGPIAKVGAGCEFANIHNATTAYGNGTIPVLALVYPGTYSISSTAISGDIFIRGVGDPATIQFLFSDTGVGLKITGKHLSVVENIKLKHSYNWRSCFSPTGATGFTPLFIANKCIIDGSSTNLYPIRQEGNNPNLILRNIYLSRGYAHIFNYDLSKIRMQRCHLNNTLYTYNCTNSLAESDYVTASTIGYGPNYGEYFISGVDSL